MLNTDKVTVALQTINEELTDIMGYQIELIKAETTRKNFWSTISKEAIAESKVKEEFYRINLQTCKDKISRNLQIAHDAVLKERYTNAEAELIRWLVEQVGIAEKEAESNPTPKNLERVEYYKKRHSKAVFEFLEKLKMNLG